MSNRTVTQDLNRHHTTSTTGPLRRAFRDVSVASERMDRMNRPWAYQGEVIRKHPIRNAFREILTASERMDRMNRPWAYQGHSIRDNQGTDRGVAR